MTKLFNWGNADDRAEKFIDNNKDYIRIGFWGFCIVHYKDRSKHTIFVLNTKRKRYSYSLWN